MFFNRSKKSEFTGSEAAQEVSSAAAAPVASGTEISGEIIAAIAAAIAAFTGSEGAGTSGLIIRKISRIHGETISWSNAGLMESIDSRKF